MARQLNTTTPSGKPGQAIRLATRTEIDSITQQVEQLRHYLQSADWDI